MFYQEYKKVKISKKSLKKIIREELGRINEADPSDALSPYEDGPGGVVVSADEDDHSETSAEEAGMADHFRKNKSEIMNSRALALAKKIAHMFPQAGLGSVSEEELPILARHILAVKAELDPLKPWNNLNE